MEFLFTLFYQPTANILFGLMDILQTQSLTIGILALVVAVKIVLLPLAVKNTRSQIKMKPILEKIKEIQKNVTEKKEQTEKILALYKENGVNPFTQILFLLVQIPIFITIFFVVKDIGEGEFSADALYGFIHHTVADTSFFLINLTDSGGLTVVLLVGISQFILMYYSQKNMAAAVSRMQKIIFVAVFPVLAAAATPFFVNTVGIYWFFNNICSILQEVLILNTIRRRENRGNPELRSVTGNNRAASPTNPAP